MCHVDAGHVSHDSQILTGDDVSDYLLDMRHLNDGIDNRREENNIRPTYEERVVLERKSPLSVGFRAELQLNGESLKDKRGRGSVWIPEELAGNDSWLESDG